MRVIIPLLTSQIFSTRIELDNRKNDFSLAEKRNQADHQSCSSSERFCLRGTVSICMNWATFGAFAGATLLAPYAIAPAIKSIASAIQSTYSWESGNGAAGKPSKRNIDNYSIEYDEDNLWLVKNKFINTFDEIPSFLDILNNHETKSTNYFIDEKVSLIHDVYYTNNSIHGRGTFIKNSENNISKRDDSPSSFYYDAWLDTGNSVYKGPIYSNLAEAIYGILSGDCSYDAKWQGCGHVYINNGDGTHSSFVLLLMFFKPTFGINPIKDVQCEGFGGY
ncbi:hypothetical protein HDV06_001122 [Boothiomyces sp. JEL0866]|nr:hypothetical protein HDV06_001122 [Boothiomyces sp. JEL0866]